YCRARWQRSPRGCRRRPPPRRSGPRQGTAAGRPACRPGRGSPARPACRGRAASRRKRPSKAGRTPRRGRLRSPALPGRAGEGKLAGACVLPPPSGLRVGFSCPVLSPTFILTSGARPEGGEHELVLLGVVVGTVRRADGGPGQGRRPRR